MVALLAHSLPAAERAALADARVDDDAVDATQLVGQLGEHLRHLLVVVDVERGHGHRDAGMRGRQLGLQFVELVDAAGTQREVTALGRQTRGPCLRRGLSWRR